MPARRPLLCSTDLRRPVAGLLVALLLLTSLAAAWHPLHEWMHADAAGPDDDCAVVMVAHGHCHATTPAPVVIAPAIVAWLAIVQGPRVVWVASVFGTSSVQEHAPPVMG